MENGKQPINPMPHVNQDGTIQHDVYFGLTKREYFAGLAMQGILASPEQYSLTNGAKDVARTAIDCADELLKQLDQ